MSRQGECDTIEKNGEGETGMDKKSLHEKQKKRAVCAGLFLGVCCFMTGCVKPVGPVVQPGLTNTPMPVPTREVPPAPTPTALPRITEEITRVPTPEYGPTKAVPPTELPSVSPTAEPVPTEAVATKPVVSPTDLPQMTPELTEMPTPELTGTITPEVTPEGTQNPLPTSVPDYEALLQNGWQRTGDFFGEREIYFSGRFTETEVIVAEGRYEYRYFAKGEKRVSFSVIGEENATVEQFLDELVQRAGLCEVTEEGEQEYCYTYSEGEETVYGRVYACKPEGTEHRMRVEMRYPTGENDGTEGYDFYLK